MALCRPSDSLSKWFTESPYRHCQVGFSRKLTQRWGFEFKRFIGGPLRVNTCGRWRKGEELRRERSSWHSLSGRLHQPHEVKLTQSQWKTLSAPWGFLHGTTLRSYSGSAKEGQVLIYKCHWVLVTAERVWPGPSALFRWDLPQGWLCLGFSAVSSPQ